MTTDLLLAPVAVAYLLVVAALFVFGLNFTYLTWSAHRNRHRRPAETMPTEPAELPFVTVQLPIYNERHVCERLIDAVASLRHPRDRIEIQVLDDSTDDTSDIAARRVARWRLRGVDIHHIRRGSRSGYKAGALHHGLERARGELIAIFDADFVPAADFLERAVAVLAADPGIAFAQGRWTHLNRSDSLITRVQAMSIDGHFGIEQLGRWSRGHGFNFNGTAGVWRRTAIEDAGGWSQRTLTEDLDLSYRAHLAGWRAAYVHDLEVPAELPVSHRAYRRQQHRWARGSFECAAHLVPRVWRSALATRDKIAATLHLLGYLIHLLLLALVVLFPLILLLAENYPSLLSLFGLMAIMNVAALAPAGLFLMGQHNVGRRWYTAVPTTGALTLIGAGMMINTARAGLAALGGRPASFERTAKFGRDSHAGRWRRLGYQERIDRIVIAELAGAGLCAYTAARAIDGGIVAIAVYAIIFGAGLALNAGLSTWQGIAVGIARRRADRQSEPTVATISSIARANRSRPSSAGSSLRTGSGT